MKIWIEALRIKVRVDVNSSPIDSSYYIKPIIDSKTPHNRSMLHGESS